MPRPVWINDALKGLRETARFWFASARLALRGKLGRVAAWVGLVSLPLVVLAAALPPSDSIERMLTITVPAVFGVTALAAAILYGFVTAPVRLYQGEVRKREAIEALRRPKLRFALPETGVVTVNPSGATSETRGGSRQTVTSIGVPNVVCLVCENIGETRIKNARARLLWVGSTPTVKNAKSVEIAEPIDLSWSRELKGGFVKELEPGEKSRIWIGGVREQGQFWVHREIADLPIEYQQVFGEAGEHLFVVQVTGDDAPPMQVLMRVRAAEGEKPQNGLWRGKADVEILEQGSPSVARSRTAIAETQPAMPLAIASR